MADVIGATKITVQPDTTGFAAKVQAAVKVALKGVKAEIPAPKADFTGVKTQADKAGKSVQGSFQDAKKASDTALGGVGGAATFVPARTSARRAADSVTDSFQRSSRESNRALSRIGDGNPFGSVLKQAFAFTIAMASVRGMLVATLIPAVIGLGAAFISVVGALGPLVGLMGALPGAFFGAVTAMGVVALAAKGVGEALKANSQQAEQSAATAKANAAAQKSAASALRSANEAVENAVKRVTRSEDSLIRAQKAAKAAQEDLTKARKQAREELEDLRLAVIGAQLSEERARINLQQAILAEAELRRKAAQDGTVNALELADAALSVREAELGVMEAIESRGDTTERANEMMAKGVEESDVVVAAQERLRDANKGVEDAIEAVSEANDDLADALTRVAEAAEAMGSAGKDNADKFRDAMNELSPAAQSFVNTLLSFKEPMKELSAVAAAGLFPGVEAGLRALTPLFTVLRPVIFNTAQALGSFTQKLGELLGSPGFSSDLARVGNANATVIRILGDAFLSIVSALRHVAVAAIPMVQTLAEMARAWAANTDAAAKAGRESGAMAAFFEKSLDTFRKVLAILGNLGNVLKNIFAGANEGLPLLDTLVRVTERMDVFIQRARDSGALANVFKTVGDIFRSVWDTIKELAPIILDIIKAFSPAFSAIGTVLSNVLSPLTSNTDLLRGLIPIIHSLNPIIIELAKIFEELAPLVAELLLALGPLIAMLAGAFVQVLGIIVRDLLPPFVEFMTKHVIPALEKLEPILPAIVAGFIGFKVLMTLAPAIGIIQSIAGAVWALTAAMLANPIGLIVIAVVALGAALFLAYKKFEPFRNIVDEVGRALRDAFGASLEWIKEQIPKVTDAFGKFMEIVRDVWKWLDENLVPVIEEFVLLIKALQPAFEIVFGILKTVVENSFMAIKGAFEIIINVVTTLWRNFGDNIWRFLEIAFNYVKGILEGALKILKGIFQTITGVLTGDWGKAWEGIKNIVAGAWDLIYNTIKTAWDLIILAFQTAFDIVLSIFQIFWDTIKTVVTTGWDIIQNIFQGAIDAIVGIFQWLYDIVVGNSIIPDLINAIFDWFKNLPGKVFDLVKDFVTKAIDTFFALKNKVFEITGNLVGDVIGGIASMPGKIIEMIPKMVDAGKRFIGGLIDGIRDMLGRVGDIGRAVANNIIGFVNRNIIDNINNFLEFEVFGKKIDAPDIHHLPYLAKGQIVDKATVAVIGEAGREVVLPLTDAKRTLELAQQSGLFEVLAKAVGQTRSTASASAAVTAGGASGPRVVFGPGSVVVELHGSMTPEEGAAVGNAAGREIVRVMEAQERLVEARAIG